ncbi:MAG: efflux RND transporter permease subunit [Pseudomonadota bacterium]
MRNISSWAIRNPVFPIVLFAVLGFLGTIAFIRLPINNMPDISFPLVQVIVSQPGAAPTELETQVAQRIEGAIANIGNVRNIQTRIIEGQSLTFIEFRIGTPVDRAVADVRDAVAKVRADLPESIEEPVVQRVDVDGGAIVYYAVGTTDMTPEQLSWFVDNTLAKRLLTLNGVAQISRSGGLNREIRIDLDLARMQALGLTAAEVNRQLRAINIDAPGGRATIGGAERAVRVLGGAKTAAELAQIRLALPRGGMARLADIASVYDGAAEQRSLARLDGRTVTSFGVFKAKGASDVAVLDSVEKTLAEMAKDYPGIAFTQTFNTVTYTKEDYRSAINAMTEGAILAVIVVWFFLRDWRAMLISALAIPLSAIPAFWIMEMLGFTLNFISLLALSLVAGILVDDAIVEIENIVRHMRMGKSAYEAALEAADEIGLAVVATTMAIVAVFVPVSFMGGVSGQYFKQFGLTVAAAVFVSLLVARLITPLIAAFFLRPHGRKAHAEGPLMQRYLRLLRWSLRHRWITLFAGFAFFVLGIGLLIALPKGFLPPFDNNFSQLEIELAPGAQLEDTARVAAAATDIVRARPEVTSVFESIGADDSGETRTATLFINLVSHKAREKTVKDIERELSPQLAAIPDARINFRSQNGGFGRDLSIVIAGDDPVLLERTARQVEAEMRTLPILRDPRINGDMPRPELVITPRFDLAAALGVSVAALGQTIRIATIGDVPQNLAKFSLNDRQVPIRVRLSDEARRDLTTLENLPVPTLAGPAVPLKAVAKISFAQGPSKIRRYNQSRRIVIGADFNGVPQGEATQRVFALPILKNLPAGVRLVEAGDIEFQRELVQNFLLAIVSGTLLVFAVIVLLYKRAFQPITNMASLLLAPGGAMIALLLTGYEVTLPVFIGVLMLFGIVAKNSILLVDFAIEEIRRGTERGTALIEAGHKRAQPIVMTTVAMIAGMLPITLGWGGDTSFRAPMAVAVIGGLITSTLLTLVIVPAAFTVVDDIERWIGAKLGRVLTARDDAHSAPSPAE